MGDRWARWTIQWSSFCILNGADSGFTKGFINLLLWMLQIPSNSPFFTYSTGFWWILTVVFSTARVRRPLFSARHAHQTEPSYFYFTGACRRLEINRIQISKSSTGRQQHFWEKSYSSLSRSSKCPKLLLPVQNAHSFQPTGAMDMIDVHWGQCSRNYCNSSQFPLGSARNLAIVICLHIPFNMCLCCCSWVKFRTSPILSLWTAWIIRILNKNQQPPWTGDFFLAVS